MFGTRAADDVVGVVVWAAPLLEEYGVLIIIPLWSCGSYIYVVVPCDRIIYGPWYLLMLLYGHIELVVIWDNHWPVDRPLSIQNHILMHYVLTYILLLLRIKLWIYIVLI